MFNYILHSLTNLRLSCYSYTCTKIWRAIIVSHSPYRLLSILHVFPHHLVDVNMPVSFVVKNPLLEEAYTVLGKDSQAFGCCKYAILSTSKCVG